MTDIINIKELLDKKGKAELADLRASLDFEDFKDLVFYVLDWYGRRIEFLEAYIFNVLEQEKARKMVMEILRENAPISREELHRLMIERWCKELGCDEEP